jgi:hypothetical protein
MQSVSSDFLAEVAKSHTAVTRCELWYNGSFVEYLYPTRGSVTVDARRAVRRSGSITVIDSDGTLSPNHPTSRLTPFGGEVRIYRGVRYPLTGVEEYVPLGVFVIASVSIRRGSNGAELEVLLEDRARVIMQNVFTSPYTIAGGTNYTTAITGMVTNRYPAAEVQVGATEEWTVSVDARVYGIENSDPWSDICDLAQADGKEAYFDASGVFRTTAVPNLSNGGAVATFAEASDGTLLDVSMNYTADGIYNYVIASWEGTMGDVASYRVWDDDVQSPTYIYGPMGIRAYTWETSYYVNGGYLSYGADKILEAVRGFPVTFSVVPNPALDVRDIVQLTAPSIDLSSTVMIDTLTIPLNVDEAMTITGRMRGY